MAGPPERGQSALTRHARGPSKSGSCGDPALGLVEIRRLDRGGLRPAAPDRPPSRTSGARPMTPRDDGPLVVGSSPLRRPRDDAPRIPDRVERPPWRALDALRARAVTEPHAWAESPSCARRASTLRSVTSRHCRRIHRCSCAPDPSGQFPAIFVNGSDHGRTAGDFISRFSSADGGLTTYHQEMSTTFGGLVTRAEGFSPGLWVYVLLSDGAGDLCALCSRHRARHAHKGDSQ